MQLVNGQHVVVKVQIISPPGAALRSRKVCRLIITHPHILQHKCMCHACYHLLLDMLCYAWLQRRVLRALHMYWCNCLPFACNLVKGPLQALSNYYLCCWLLKPNMRGFCPSHKCIQAGRGSCSCCTHIEHVISIMELQKLSCQGDRIVLCLIRVACQNTHACSCCSRFAH